MTNTEKLHETLGELLYVVAMADGVILDSEQAALKTIIEKHSWAKNIEWSFNYEASNQNSIDEVYAKVIAVCSRVSPSPIYNEFIESMEIVADADGQEDNKETKVINSFSKDLIERFIKDIENLED